MEDILQRIEQLKYIRIHHFKWANTGRNDGERMELKEKSNPQMI